MPLRLLLSIFVLVSLNAQTAGIQTANIHVSASTVSASTAKAMFGRLPKGIVAAQVLVCNDSTAALSIPLAKISQQLRPNGYTVLAPDISFVIIAASQGRSGMATALRWSVAAIQIAAVAASWSGLAETIKNTLEASALIGGQSLSIVSTAIPTHTYLTLQSESLPDPLQIPADGCAKPGVVLAEVNSAAKTVDLLVPVPMPQK